MRREFLPKPTFHNGPYAETNTAALSPVSSDANKRLEVARSLMGTRIKKNTAPTPHNHAMKIAKAPTTDFNLASLEAGSIVVIKNRLPRFFRPKDPLDEPALFVGGPLKLKELGIVISRKPGAEVEA